MHKELPEYSYCSAFSYRSPKESIKRKELAQWSVDIISIMIRWVATFGMKQSRVLSLSS